MTAGPVLRFAFTPSGQQVKSVLLDCIWRFIWLILCGVATLVFGVGITASLGSLEWEGPDLGASSPIILLAALRQFWTNHGAFLLTAFGALLLVWIVLWFILESVFRGGWKGFWIYLGTSAARTALLFGAAGIFLMLAVQEDSGGTLVIGGTVVLGMWFIVGLMESVVRRNAVDLLATNLLTLAAVLGCLRFVESILAFLVLGPAALVLLKSEAPLAGLFVGAAILFWMIVQSYMVAVRYSAVDIMRRNVVGN